ncbi:scyllo-inositol 2-dehydrogenase (NADP+) [Kushneria sinocarnis]|uniref:Scyllo-inositol 2-dehydrogenase (NADP+) n=1 Tax=Kushneria sinocarnis TaxID=595502 RepID=A0A420X0D6_9GAMM|nr:oxidoreductase [Kushneria sinocarnis]RKR07311.1 scyllo-inositol 2-dehydrogenase (NADP+) [Kushneria sinocarnis]
MTASSHRLTTGLIGYGTAGAAFHAPLIGAEPRLELTAVASSRQAQIAHDLPGVTITEPTALIEDPAIALVVIATPNTSHAELAEHALRAGKHVVIDKPFTVTAERARALTALAHERGLLLSVFHNRRWDSDFLTLAGLLRGGQLGEVLHYEAHFDRFRPTPKTGWRETTEPGSGVLYDLGAHLIDQALVLFGLPEAITADVQPQREQARVDDWFHLLLRYGRRRVILGASCMMAGPGPHLAVHGDGGSFVKYGLDVQEAQLKAGGLPGQPGWGEEPQAQWGLYTDAQGRQQHIASEHGRYEAFYAGVAAAALEGAPLPVSAAQAGDVIRVIEAAHRSARERREIALER